MANEVFNVYADDSCSAESFVLSAPLEVLSSILGLHHAAENRIKHETQKGLPCVLIDHRGAYPLRLSRLVVVKAVR